MAICRQICVKLVFPYQSRIKDGAGQQNYWDVDLLITLRRFGKLVSLVDQDVVAGVFLEGLQLIIKLPVQHLV